MLICCQVSLLIFLCLVGGFLLGIWLSHEYDINGLEDLWNKFLGLFNKVTPYLPKAVFGNDFQNVYEPAEDTYLLLDALECDLNLLKQNVNICLECGSGSGTVITALSLALSDSNNVSQRRLMFASDINQYATRTTKKCAEYHKQAKNIEVINTNLAESLVDRLENSVDLLVFNPPYVPTDDSETVDGCSQVQAAWAGGKNGRNLIDIFLKAYVPRLLSRPNGVAYMVALVENNVLELKDILLQKYDITGIVVKKRQIGPELLHVIRYQWNK